MAACGFESLSANEVGVCVSLVLLFSTRRGLEIGHFTVQSALPNIYEYKQRFRNQKKEALGRNGLSVIHTDRQTDRHSLVTAFRQHIFLLLTDQNTSAYAIRNKTTRGNKSQTIVVRPFGILKWLRLLNEN
jgi:hypothetical protein